MANRPTLPEVLEFEGREIDQFLEYDKRKLTKEEKDSLKEADEFYKTQCS